MRIKMSAPLFVIGKSTQQGKKDQTVTYYYITCSQGEDEAGKIRVADADTFNRIEKYKQQLFVCEFNDQYNSFSIVDVDSMSDTTPEPTPAPAPTPTPTPAPDTGSTGKSDKKH